jgi:nitrogen fixation NifU-like protein
MYHDQLMDHYHNPRHHGSIASPTFSTGQYNPSCGDAVALTGIVKDGILADIAFQGKGCVISQAAASMLCAYACGKSVAEIAQLDAEFMLNLVGIPLGPTRLRCALLVLYALKQGIGA